MEVSEYRLKLLGSTDLIPGLPDDVAINCILPRLSWAHFPSLLEINRSWNSAFASRRIADIRRSNPSLQDHLLAVIHKTTSRGWDHLQEDTATCPWIMDINLAVSIYDPILSIWEELPPIPSIPHGAPMFARCVCVDGKLLVLGGCNPENWEPVEDVYKMDLARGSRKWERCKGMNTARANFACTCHEGKVFVAGGHGKDSRVLATTELFDVQKGNWSSLPDLNVPRSDCLGAIFNDQIHIVGGYTSSPVDAFPDVEDDLVVDPQSTYCISSMEILDKQRKTWVCTTSKDVSLHSFEVASGQLCPLIGGEVYSFNNKTTRDGMLISHFPNEEDDDGTYLALAAVSINQDIYAITRDKQSCYGGGFRFCKGRKGKACAWQSIECPFEIVELAPSCCLVSI